MMKNRFEQYSNSTLRSFNKEQLIEYIRLLQENLQLIFAQYERAVEANRKLSECITEEKMKEIEKELFKKWADDEKDEIR